MKNTLYILSFLCLFLTTSCSQEWDGGENPIKKSESGTITLTLRSVEAQCRATQVGEAARNENLIKSVHYFFYPKDGTDTNTEKEPAKMGQVTNLDKQNEHTITINASEDEIKNVLFKFPYNDCDVYVIVNLPADIDIEAMPDRKLSTLKKISVATSFEANLTQESFVMEGLDVATVIDRNKVLAASGVIPVDRVASKISISVSVEERLDLQTPPGTPDNQTSGMIWTSNPEQMKIEFVNGSNRAVLSGNPDDATLTVDDMFTDNNDARTFVAATNDGEELWSCEPFYTYPIKWEIGSYDEPYLFITLPWTTVIWTEVDGQTPPIYRTYPCYYKIMLSGDELVRNTWYDLKINIGILGSFENTPEVILPIEGTDYFVADWSSGLEVDSEILGARYLVVDKLTYEVYNQDTLRIPFSTSHPCEIYEMSFTYENQGTITYHDYSNDTADENASYTWSNDTWRLELDGMSVLFAHKLRNDLSAGKGNYDYAPYTIKFRIRHKDEPDKYYKDITIKQYPAMLIECFPNRKKDNNGCVSVNGGSNNYGGVHGLNGGNKNPNMYVIKTTVLPPNSDKVLGDPRSNNVNHLTDWYPAWAKGIEALNGDNRRLTNYFPTEESADFAKFIAPKFRIASSYGVTNDLSYNNAKKRCASYQEDGYPAGRWRLATQAEIAYIVQLSADDVIPTLFSEGNEYWCAGGRANPQNGGGVIITPTTDGSGPVRCVYDEWYWEQSEYPRVPDANVTSFIWGDEI